MHAVGREKASGRCGAHDRSATIACGRNFFLIIIFFFFFVIFFFLLFGRESIVEGGRSRGS